MTRAPLWSIGVVGAWLLAACSGGGITVGPGATAPGSDGLSGTLTWDFHEVSDNPMVVPPHAEFDDHIVLNLKVNEPQEGQWVDAGSTYTRQGTKKGGCLDEHWSSSGTVNVNDDATLQIDGVDRLAGTVLYTAFIGAELQGTDCQGKAIHQTAMEWTNIPKCEEAKSDTVVTGHPSGFSTDGGRTIVLDCKSVADESNPGGQTIHAEASVNGALNVAPRR